MECQGSPVEEGLTSVFVDLLEWGTRMQSIIFVDDDGQATFVERTRLDNSSEWQRVEYKFKVHSMAL